jgi:hypothetical protein
MTFSIAGPETQGGYVLGFPLVDLLDADERSSVLPMSFSAAYPNPFNATVSIPFTLQTAGHVSLRVYDVLGHGVATLLDDYKSGGAHLVSWDAADAPSGIFFARLESERYTQNQKLVLLK